MMFREAVYLPECLDEFLSISQVLNLQKSLHRYFFHVILYLKGKGKAVPLEALSGTEGSRKLRFPDFVTTAQDVGKIVSLTHWPPLPQEMLLVLISVRG